MTKGVLGIIICPMNDDQLVHSISGDSEVDRVVVLKNDYSEIIGKKLESKGVAVEYIPEEKFDNGEVEFDRGKFNIVIKTNSLGLHAEPDKLRAYVEKQIVDIQPYVDALGLYYGLCGTYGWDITEWAKQNCLKPVAVFRGEDGKVCDDCVSIVVGGPGRYYELEKKYTGMFYLTPSIAENWVDFVAAGESGQQLESIPEETRDELNIHTPVDMMRWMFELGGYEYILRLDTGYGNRPKFIEISEEIGEALKLKPIDAEEGWVTDYPTNAIYEECRSYLN